MSDTTASRVAALEAAAKLSAAEAALRARGLDPARVQALAPEIASHLAVAADCSVRGPGGLPVDDVVGELLASSTDTSGFWSRPFETWSRDERIQAGVEDRSRYRQLRDAAHLQKLEELGY
jgi:hypothetical protein